MKIPIKIVVTFCIVFLYSNFCFSQNLDKLGGKFVLVIDVQKYYTEKYPDNSSMQESIFSINRIIENLDTNNVIYFQGIHRLLNLSFSIPPIYVSVDTTAMYFDSRLNLVNEHILTKSEPNAFSIKELNDFLKQNNATEIVIIGFMAEYCVYESLIGGKELGYEMYVIPEALAAKSEKSKQKVLMKLKKKGINVLHL